MSETADKTVRLSKVAREFNQGLHTVVEFLAAKGFKVEQNPNAKIGAQEYDLLQAEYGTSKAEKEASKQTVQAREVARRLVGGLVGEHEVPIEELLPLLHLALEHRAQIVLIADHVRREHQQQVGLALRGLGRAEERAE